MTWRIPEVGDKLWINPEFDKIAWERDWHKQLWYMRLSDGGAFQVERVVETEHTVCIKVFESPIEVAVSKETGQIWWFSGGPQMFLLEDSDG